MIIYMRTLMILEIILDQMLKINKFQDYVNRKSSFKCGMHLSKSIQNTNVENVFDEYHFTDIQPSDIVLDIGANVGAFSIFVSKFVKHVYAVEPMVTDLLKENIRKNNIKNIVVLGNECLGYGNVDILWANKTRKMIGSTLKELIQLCGGHIDFLKCDCEGEEWNIRPEELSGIRRIEIELHNQYNDHNYDNFLNMLKDSGFEYKTHIAPDNLRIIVHAKRKE